MKTISIGAFQAKTHLSEILNKVTQGHVYIITKRGRPVAEVKGFARGSKSLRFGEDRGRIKMTKDFDAPLEEFKDYGG